MVLILESHHHQPPAYIQIIPITSEAAGGILTVICLIETNALFSVTREYTEFHQYIMLHFVKNHFQI